MSPFLEGLGSTLFGKGLDFITGLFGSNKQYEQNKELQHQQYLYNSQLQAAQNQFNAQQQDRQNVLTKELFGREQQFNADQAELANQRNRQNLADSAQLNREGLQKAGLNINMLNGGFSPVATSGSASAGASASGAVGGSPSSVGLASVSSPLFGSMGDIASASLAMSNAKLAHEQAESIAIQNNRERTADDWFKQHGVQLYTIDEDGQPSVQSVNFTDKGAFDSWLNWRTSDAKVTEADAQKAQNVLKQYIANDQFNNTEIRKALTEMPLEQFKDLVQMVANHSKDLSVKDSTINLNNSQKALNELEADIKDDSNIFGYIDKYIENETMNDLCKFLYIIGCTFSGKGVSFGGKKKGKSSKPSKK